MKRIIVSVLFASASALAQTGPFGIATIAGSPYDVSGDNGPATQAAFALSGSVFRAGNLYITDGNRVRKIAPTGIITTIVGLLDPVVHQPIPGYSGDGGPGLGAAQVHGVDSLDMDSAGNLYIAEATNACIRKLTARTVGGVPQPFDGTEIISTVAGQCLFIGNSGDGGPATSGKINFPRGISVDPVSGALYIADFANNNIRKVLGGTITTIAGDSVAGFSGDLGPATAAQLNGPTGVAVNPATGDLFIADLVNNRVRKVSGGIITTLAGTGTSSAIGNNPLNIRAFKLRFGSGILYAADSGVATIRTIDAGGNITTVAGIGLSVAYTGPFPPVGDGGPWLAASFKSVVEPALDGQGGIFILDSSTRRIRYAAGPAATVLGQTVAAGDVATVGGPPGTITFYGDGGAALAARLFSPGAIAADQTGNIDLIDGGNNRIRQINAARTIQTIAGNGSAGFSLPPSGVATSATIQPGNLALGSDGLYLTSGGRALKLAAGLLSIVADQTGVTSPPSINGTPAVSAVFGVGGVAFDVAGNLYVGDTTNNLLWKIDSTGTVRRVAGGGSIVIDGVTVLSAPATSALLDPASLTFDSSGNLYFSDNNQNRIYKITAHAPGQPLDGTETVTLFAGNGAIGYSGDGGPAVATALSFPGGLSVDKAGNLYMVDGTFRVRAINSHGIISTVAGTGMAGFSGDGGPATLANIRGGSLAIDPTGNIFMTDGLNQVVRVLDNTPPMITFTGNAGVYTLAQSVSIVCTAQDSGAGLTNSNCGSIGGPAGSFAPGVHTFSTTATDRAGNVASASVSFTVVSGPAPANGNACNGYYNGTFNGNVNLSAGQTCAFVSGGITGNVQGAGNLVLSGTSRVTGDTTLTGGQLALSASASIGGNLTLSGGSALAMNGGSVGGNLTVNGGGQFSIGPSAAIGNNLTVQSVASGVAPSQVCGTSIKGNLTVQSDGSGVQVGSANPSCPGNGVGGNLQVQQNTGSMSVFNNMVSGNLQCQNNSSVLGAGNTAKQKQGQCAAF